MRRIAARTVAAIAALVSAAAIVGAGGTIAAPGAAAVPRTREPQGEILVAAAASLEEAFTRIGERFESRYEDTSVTFSFDGSSALAVQIRSGAPVDVFASADEVTMDRLVADDLVATGPIVFARNELEIATKPGNPARIRSLADLARAGTIALCAQAVPCGSYADAALKSAGVRIPRDRVTRGLNARATLAAVTQGDADAAIVYVTDVRSAGTRADGVRIAARDNRIATYPIAALGGSSNPRTAKAFTRFVASAAAQKVLVRHGFRGA